MITKQTAYDLWVAYDEVEKGNKLILEREDIAALIAEIHRLRKRLADLGVQGT
jgi:hypothetical protein